MRGYGYDITTGLWGGAFLLVMEPGKKPTSQVLLGSKEKPMYLT